MNKDIDEWVKRMIEKSGPASNPVAEWIAGSRIVAFQTRFTEITESITSALLLSQMWYWSQTQTTRDREGWFWLTQAEITEQTGLSRYEQETARRRLRDLGLIEEKKRGVPMKLWFRLNKERFFELIAIHLEKK